MKKWLLILAVGSPCYAADYIFWEYDFGLDENVVEIMGYSVKPPNTEEDEDN